MRFLVDAQLPPALARWIGERGFSATPVRDLGLRDSDDGSIEQVAATGDWIVITKDDDFVERCLNSKSALRVIWLRIGNCTNKVLFDWFDPLWPEIVRKLEAGEIIVEVRRAKLG
jgi:predicted nuclease of predicted toxin-antitoxin system